MSNEQRRGFMPVNWFWRGTSPKEAIYPDDAGSQDHGSVSLEALAALGVAPNLDPLPLIAQWDFSAPMCVWKDSEGVSRIGARNLSGNAIGFDGAGSSSSPVYGLDPLYSSPPGGPGLDWSATGQFPNADRMNGRTVWKQTATSFDQLSFTRDAPVVAYPDLFFVFKLSNPVALTAMYGSNALNFPYLLIKDIGGGVLKWAVAYSLDGGASVFVLRPTNATVDTNAHVLCLPLRGDQSDGLWMDGVHYPFTDSDPVGWAGHDYPVGTFDFTWCGNGGANNLGYGDLPSYGSEGLYAEARIYNALTDAERVIVTNHLMSKWGVS